MHIKQLRHFVAAVQTGNLRKASENIHLTAPALSISLKNLEEELGVKLLIKNRHGVEMTYAGQKFLSGAHSLLKQIDDLQASLMEAQDSPAGNVRLGIPFGACNALASPLFKTILNNYPGINLKIDESNTANLERLYDDDLLDLMINYDVDDHLDRRSELLYIEHMYLVGEYDEKLEGVDEIESSSLEKHPIVSSPGTHSMRRMMEKHALDNGINFNYLIDFQSAYASLRIVEDGLAYTIAPWCLISDHVKTNLVTARKIINPSMERTAYLISSRNKSQSAATIAIVGAIKLAILEAIGMDRLRAKSLLS